MMKFQNFEVLYGAACEILAAAGDCHAVNVAVNKQKKVLLAQFAANFPSSLEEAAAYPEFKIQQFINMLLAFPEVLTKAVLKEKAERLSVKFSALLSDMAESGIPVPAELKTLCEELKEKPKTMSPEEKAIAEALKTDFPDNIDKLAQLPFTQDAVLAFLVEYPDATHGKRRQFISLMDDLCRHHADLPTELKIHWRGLVMQP